MTGVAVVTGATGHVGANLVRALLDRGRAVRVLVREKDHEALRGLVVERMLGDVRDPDASMRLLTGCDVLYHLAAQISIVGPMGGLVHEVICLSTRDGPDAELAELYGGVLEMLDLAGRSEGGR